MLVSTFHDIVNIGKVGLHLFFNIIIMNTDILFVDDDTQFDDNVEGIAIHRECLSQDFDDIAWEPEVDDTPDVNPNDDVFGFYNK